MKKILLAASVLGLIALAGCQAIQDQADNLRKQSENTINGFSQQAETVRTQVIDTKAKYDEKAKQILNAADAVNTVLK